MYIYINSVPEIMMFCFMLANLNVVLVTLMVVVKVLVTLLLYHVISVAKIDVLSKWPHLASYHQ